MLTEIRTHDFAYLEYGQRLPDCRFAFFGKVKIVQSEDEIILQGFQLRGLDTGISTQCEVLGQEEQGDLDFRNLLERDVQLRRQHGIYVLYAKDLRAMPVKVTRGVMGEVSRAMQGKAYSLRSPMLDGLFQVLEFN
jgi:hypothetical protein